MAKYNQLLRIEEELGDLAVYGYRRIREPAPTIDLLGNALRWRRAFFVLFRQIYVHLFVNKRIIPYICRHNRKCHDCHI